MLRSSLVITAISILGYLASFCNQLTIAQQFGASAALDAYLVAVSIPLFVMTAMSGLFSYTLVPHLVRSSLKANTHVPYASLLLLCVVALALSLGTVGSFATPALVNILVPLYPASTQADIGAMTRLMWVACGIGIIESYLTAVNHTARLFSLPALVGVLPYLGMILCAKAFGRTSGPITLVVGMLLGHVAATVLLAIPIQKSFAFNRDMFFRWRDAAQLFSGMPLMLCSLVGLSVYGTVDAVWVSRLSVSSLSHLGYAQKLVLAVGTLILLGPLTVILPHLSEAVAQGRLSDCRAQLLRSLRMLLCFSSLVAVLISLLRVPLVICIFERGAFDRTASRTVSSLLPGLCLGVTEMVSVILLFRALYAKGDNRGAAMIALSGAGFYYVGSGVLSARIGLNGIVTAYLLAWAGQFVWVVYRIWTGHLAEVLNRASLQFICRLSLGLLACAASTRAALLLVELAPFPGGLMTSALRVAICAAAGSIGFLIVTMFVFRMEEITLVSRALLGRRISHTPPSNPV
jgi:putative peptidoglycan lipid II flippase